MHVDDDVDHSGRPNIAADDQLNLFRHLTGITSHPSMVHAHFDGGGRPAPNLGMYARIVSGVDLSCLDIALQLFFLFVGMV